MHCTHFTAVYRRLVTALIVLSSLYNSALYTLYSSLSSSRYCREGTIFTLPQCIIYSLQQFVVGTLHYTKSLHFSIRGIVHYLQQSIVGTSPQEDWSVCILCIINSFQRSTVGNLQLQFYRHIHQCIIYPFIIIIIIYPFTTRVVGAPQMISQPVSSISLCSPVPSGTWRTPGLSIP